MFLKSAVAVAILCGVVAAQSSSNSTIDPNSVPASTRSTWCSGEIATCGTLCGGTYLSNECFPDTLVYNCTCTNGTAPGLQYYEQTMPTFICEQIFQNCIVAGQNDAAAQAVCNNNEKANCGHLNPANYTPPVTTTSSAASTASATGSSTASTSSPSKGAAASLAIGREFGTGLVAAAIAAAFGFML